MNEIPVQSLPAGIVFREIPKHKLFRDITGEKFSFLTALGLGEPFVLSSGRTNQRWWFECECGNIKLIDKQSVINKSAKSCGCMKASMLRAANTIHGKSDTPEAYAWSSMIRRCYNPSCNVYRYYGGRGITVCDRWKHSMESFINDMGPRPEGRYSLDRIDNDKNYELSNCRWATKIAQARNTRANKLIEFNGKTQCVSAWSEELNVPSHLLYDRIRRGWAFKDAITLSATKAI